jgi:MFS transporter, DHA2 family, multidrug resistance protein
LIGAAAFGAASLLAAFSVSAEILIFARALLGLAAATLAPSTLSLIRNMFLDPQQRTFAIGVWIASFSAGGAIGPLIGGLLLEHFWWGSVFLVNVPVMVFLLILGPIVLPEFRDPKTRRLDPISVALSLVSILAVIYGIKKIAEGGQGWMPGLPIGAGLAIGALFLHRQRTLPDPLIDLSLFRSPAFGVSLLVNVIGFFIAFGTFFFVAQYLQLVLGLSPFIAGLWTAPSGVAFIAGSLLAPWLAGRMRPIYIIAIGFAVAAVGFSVLAAGTQGLAPVVTGYVILSLGLAPVFTLATDLIVGSAPAERAGIASGLSETSAELGGALGIALLGSLITAIYRTGVVSALPADLPDTVASAVRDTLGSAVAMAGTLSDQSGSAVLGAARAAFTEGFVAAATGSAALAVLAALTAVTLLRNVGSRS